MNMKVFVRRKVRRDQEAGITLIEVMIAGVIMVIGFMALFGLFITAIASNNRNKLDSTGTMLAQSVVENINSVLARPAVDALSTCTGTECLYTLTDCDSNSWVMNTGVGGAHLSGSQIDFTQATPPDEYYMNFHVCNVNSNAIYDVRWNVQAVNSSTYLVTVGVKKKGQTGDGGKNFALPVNLQTFVSAN